MQIILTEMARGLKVFVANIHRHVLVFLIFPLVLGVLYGALYQSFNAVEVKLKPLQVYYHGMVEGLDAAVGRDLPYVELTLAADPVAVRTLTASNPASLGLVVGNDNSVTVINKHEVTLERMFFTRYAEHAVYALASKVPMDKRVTITELSPRPRMGVAATMHTSAFTGVSLFLVFTLVGIFLNAREKHITKRLMTLSFARWQLYLGNMFYVLLVSFVFTYGYFLISYRLILRLAVPLLSLALSALTHSLFLASLYGFLISLFKQARTFRNIATPVIMMFMFLGGTVFPIDSFKGANSLASFTPNYLLKNIYEYLVVNQSAFAPQALTLLIISVLLLVGGAVQFSLREQM